MSDQRFFQKLIRFAASYGVSIVLLFLLFMLVLVGTLEQVDQGLFMVQKKYFESFIVVHEFFNTIPVPLPGVNLLLTLLTINLILGTVVRGPKNWKRPGMFIAHLGVLLLLVAGFVTFHFSTNGHMTLYEGEASSTFQSYHEWEITITEVNPAQGSGRQFIIPHDAFLNKTGNRTLTFHYPAMPFTLQLDHVAWNAKPQPQPASGQQAAGFVIQPLPDNPEAEQNIPGAQATVLDAQGGQQKDILWGMQQAPWVVTVGAQKFSIDLRHRRWEVPFTIRLDKFTRDLHPGTMMAANYMSDVTMTENGIGRQVNIRMNAPLRHKGFTFFQSSWGPSNAGPDAKLYSVFAVVKNPADQWPLYSCIVTSFGLLLHFLQKLLRYLRQQHRRMA